MSWYTDAVNHGPKGMTMHKYTVRATVDFQVFADDVHDAANVAVERLNAIDGVSSANVNGFMLESSANEDT